MPHEADLTKWPKLRLGTSYLSHMYNNPESNPDFTIRLSESGRSILTHKLLLSAASGFFRGLFHSGMIDSGTDSYTFQPSNHVDHLNPVLAERAVEHVIQLLYYGDFEVIRGLDGLNSDDNDDDVIDSSNRTGGNSVSRVESELEMQKEIELVVQMLHVANFFEMDHMTTACAAILGLVTNDGNVFFHVTMPSNKQFAFLKQKCAQHLSDNRDQIFCQSTVSLLSYELLVGLLLHLSSHKMSQSKMTTVFNCWKSSDPEMRESLRQQFLDELQLGSVKDLSWYESKLLPMIEQPYSIFRYMKQVKHEFRVLSLGLDGSGRTTMLYQLKYGKIHTTVSTTGFNVEKLTLGNSTLTMWDVGGGEKMRPLWGHYYQDLTGLIVVIDSTDHDRLDEVRDVLHTNVLDVGALIGLPILFCANKQDLPDALPVAQLMKHLELSTITGRPWFIQTTSAITGDGIHKGIEWLVHQMS